jgi:hypothetical protein
MAGAGDSDSDRRKWQRAAVVLPAPGLATTAAAAATAAALADRIEEIGEFPAWLAFCTEEQPAHVDAEGRQPDGVAPVYLDLEMGLADGLAARSDTTRTSTRGTDKSHRYPSRQSMEDDIVALGAAAESQSLHVPMLVAQCWLRR